MLRFGVLGAARIVPWALIEPAARRDDVSVVAVAARRPGAAEALASEHGISKVYDSYEALLTDPDVDVIYNPLPPHSVSFDDWETTLRVNTLGPARVSFALRDSLALAGGAKLVTISSDWGSVSNHPGTAYDYCSSKAAVNSVMRGLAKNWRGLGITVLLLHPGWMRTSMGGADAPNLPADSALLVKGAIDRITSQDSGRYVDSELVDMPW
jgi:hypothetical protein